VSDEESPAATWQYLTSHEVADAPIPDAPSSAHEVCKGVRDLDDDSKFAARNGGDS
jgi:hypothetical protein